MIAGLKKEEDEFQKKLKKIAELEKEIFPTTFYSFEQLKEMLTDFEYYHCFYLSEREEILAYVLVLENPDSFEVLKIATDGNYRRKGMATKLLNKLQEKDIFLEVRETNETAIAFYQEHGFEEIGKRKHYYNDNQENAIVMKMEGNYEL